MNRFAPWLCVVSLLVGCSKEDSTRDPGGLSVDPTSISFGKVFVGSSGAETVVLSNSDRTLARVTVGSLPAGYRMQPASVDVPGGSSVEVTVSFDPEVAGASNGDVDLHVTGANSATIAIAVEGEGVAEALSYDEPLDFGVVAMGTTKTLPLPVTSNVDFRLSAAVEVEGGNGADVFSVESSTLELSAGQATALQVTFEPSRRGALSSFVDVRSCDECPVSRIRLTGVGGLDALSAQPVDFRTRSGGSESSLPLVVHNVGDLPVSIASLDVSGSFAFEISDERSVELAPGDVAEYTVVFHAGYERGERMGTVRFRNTDGNLRPEVVPIRATVGGIRIVSSPEGVDFGRQPAGVRARKKIVLENRGEGRVVYLIDPAFEDGSRFTLEPGARADGPVPDGWRIDVERRPVSFEIAFEADELGTYTDALTFRIASPYGSSFTEQSEVRIPIVAQVIEPLPCELRIDPQEVRFGAVWASGIHTKDVSVTNVGTTECFLWGVEAQAATRNLPFETESRSDETYVLGPGKSLETRIIYAPRPPRNSIDEAFLVFQQAGGEVRTRVTGQAVGFNVTVRWNPISHGIARSRFAETNVRQFSISNLGSTPVFVDGFRVGGGDVEFFGVAGVPGVIAGGASTLDGYLHSWFAPTRPGTSKSQMEIAIQGVEEPVLVDMRGLGEDNACGERCWDPTALCPAPTTVAVHDSVEVRGSGWSPGGSDLRCQWSVAQAPRGSRAAELGEGCTPSFTPDVVGNYVLELRVTNDAWEWSTCETLVAARAFGGIHVETYSDTDGNVDLHVLNEAMGNATVPASWWSGADCHYANPNPTWDAGFPGASPSLDRDDTGAGPESVAIPNPAPHGYAVGVHNRGDAVTPVEITTNVHCGGALIANVTTVSRAPGEFFVLGSVDDSCRWTPLSGMWTEIP